MNEYVLGTLTRYIVFVLLSYIVVLMISGRHVHYSLMRSINFLVHDTVEFVDGGPRNALWRDLGLMSNGWDVQTYTG